MTFDKSIYWDRRNKGLHGQIHEWGSKEQRYDNRVMDKKQLADTLKAMKGKKNEPKKSKAV